MTIESQCITCKHFINDGAWGCKAFTFIPDSVVANKVVHDHKIDGQKGNYLYKQMDVTTK